MWNFRKLAVVIALIMSPGLAHAQSAQELADEIQAMVGTWEVSNADRDRICQVTFATDPVPGGMKIDFAPECAEVFELTRDVTAWRLDKNGLHFFDNTGRALLDLDEVEKGIFEGMRQGDGRYFVQSLTAVRAEAKPEQIVGDWQVSRGTDETICVIAFSQTPAAGEFALELKPGCAALVTSFAPASWKIDRGELVISSAKGSWRFEEAGEIAWRRVPEGTDPLWLVRQTGIMPLPEGGG